jgi:hypothetical protein
MKSSTPKEKIYKEYPTNEDDFSSMVNEPAVVYASSFNDMVRVSNYDKEYAADLLDVSYKTITRYQKEKPYIKRAKVFLVVHKALKTG